MSILPDHYPHLEPSRSSSNQLATRVTLPFMGGSESQLRGGFRNFVKRGDGETTSWHAILPDGYRQLWHIVNIESTAFEGSDNALC
jgi:hypothetical protein